MKQQAKKWNVPNVFLDLNNFQGLTATPVWAQHTDKQLLLKSSEWREGHSETTVGSLLISYSLCIYWPQWLSILSHENTL